MSQTSTCTSRRFAGKVAHKKKNDRHAQRKRVQNLRALAKALKHNLHETEFFQMFDPFCHDLTARRSNSYLYFTSNPVDGIMCNVKRIRIMAKGRRFVYQTISFIRGVSFGAKLAYEKLFLGRRIDLILLGYLS